ncbi:unnamed protein product, partial [Cyprideis torosa]
MAAQEIEEGRRFHIKTPCILDRDLTLELGRPVYLKLENIQPPGSFKIRGIGNLVKTACKNGATHLVSSSGGNAGISAVYAGREIGVRTTVIIPECTPPSVAPLLKKKGAAEVIVHGHQWSEAHKYAEDMVSKDPGAFLIHPYDHPAIWEGVSSIVDELKHQLPEPPSEIALAVGGGGLLSGVLLGLRKHNWQDAVRVTTLETDGSSCFFQSVQAKHLVTVEKITSIARTLGAQTPASFLSSELSNPMITALTVSDREAVDAQMIFADSHRHLVEPACGAALSYVYCKRLRDKVTTSTGPLVVIVCGGAAATLEAMSNWKRLVGLMRSAPLRCVVQSFVVVSMEGLHSPQPHHSLSRHHPHHQHQRRTSGSTPGPSQRPPDPRHSATPGRHSQPDRKHEDFKLLIDPFLTSNRAKLYRYKGVVPNDPTYPEVILRDPRTKRVRLFDRLEEMDLPVPRFKIDKNYEGSPPPVEVTVMNLNDNVDKAFFSDLVNKYGETDEVEVYRHRVTGKHLGFGRAVFLE